MGNVQLDQSDQLLGKSEKSLLNQLLVPTVSALVGAAALIGGMRWALNSLDRQVESNIVECKAEDSKLTDRITTLDNRQVANVQRIAELDGQVKALSEVINDLLRQRVR